MDNVSLPPNLVLPRRILLDQSVLSMTVAILAILTRANRLSALGHGRDPQTLLPLTDRILVPAILPARPQGRKATKRFHRARCTPFSHSLVNPMELLVQSYTDRQRNLPYYGLVRCLPRSKVYQMTWFLDY